MTGFPGFVFLLHSTRGAERLPDGVQRKETGSDRSVAGAIDPPSRTAPSLAILGADALLAAQPATAVQLAHACARIGYHSMVPASWGDELVAAGCLRHIATRRGNGNSGPAIFCACPYVAHRLLAVGPDLEPFLTSFVPPPVAVARYLRAVYTPWRIRLTYVGRCPGAADDSIDARITPEELLAVLTERGVDLAEQPRVFDSVIPPDRRRFLSQPGGLPTLDVLKRVDQDRRIVEVMGPELVGDVAQQLLAKQQVLLDLAPRLGCACSGAVADTPPEAARGRVTALEPPRAASPIVDDRVPIEIDLPLPSVARDPVDVVPAVATRRSSGSARVVPVTAPTPEPPTTPTVEPPPNPLGRRRSPTHGVAVRQQPGSVPTTRSGEGRALPRAYVARRGQRPGARGATAEGGERAGSGGRRSTPPRGEPQQFEASGRAGGRAANGGAPRGAGPSPAPAPAPTPSAEPAKVQTASVEMPRHAQERMTVAVATPIGAAPDRAADPHGERIVTEMTLPDPAPRVDMSAAAESTRTAPISEVSAAPVVSFRMRTAKFARIAVSAAQRRRGMIGALLAVALLSATIGIVAGRWLAAKSETPAATR